MRWGLALVERHLLERDHLRLLDQLVSERQEQEERLSRVGEMYQFALRAITIMRQGTYERDVCGEELGDDVRVEGRGSG